MNKAILAILVVVVIAGASVVFLLSKQKGAQQLDIAAIARQAANEVSQQSLEATDKYNQYVSQPQATPITAAVNQQVGTTITQTWKTYVNNTYSFLVKYPASAKITDNTKQFAGPVSFTYSLASKSGMQVNIGLDPSYCSEAFLPAATTLLVGDQQFYKLPSTSGVAEYFLITKDKGQCYNLEFLYHGDKQTVADHINGYLSSFKLI